jgi:hypothetical protein
MQTQIGVTGNWARQSSCRKMPTAFVISPHFWKWLAWLSKMLNQFSGGGVRRT